MGVTNQCIASSNNKPCTELFDGKEFVMGGGDEEDEIFDWFTNIDCPWCETPTGCGSGPKTGPEEIENALNFNIIKPISSNPAKPYLQGYVDVECKLVLFRELEDEEGSDCDVLSKHVDYCLDEDKLSCMYCLMSKYIHGNLYPVEIPSGSYLSNVNVFVKYCTCDKASPCDYQTQVEFKYCYGKPVFKGPVGPFGDPVSNDLPTLEFP